MKNSFFFTLWRQCFLQRGKRWKTLVRVCGGVGLIMMAASPAQAETLKDALAAAYMSNPMLLSERAAVRASDEGVSQASAGMRPNLGLNSSYGWNRQSTKSESLLGRQNTRSNLHPATTSVSLGQNLFNGFQTLNQIDQADSLVEASRANLVNVEQQVLLDAVTAYFDVYQNEAEVRLNQGQVQVLTRQLGAAEDRFQVGEVTNTDVAQSKARLAFAQSNLIRAEAALATSRASYERVVGQAPGTLELGELPALPDAEEEALSVAVTNNPVIQAARYAEEASYHGVKVSKGALWPSLDLETQYGYNREPSDSVERVRGISVTGRLTMPLYQSGIGYSRVREALQRNAQDRLLVADTWRQLTEGARRAWASLRSAEAQIVSDREQVKANQIALEGVRQEAEVGSRTTLDVLDAEQALLDARVSLTRSQRNHYVAAYSLLSIMGALNARGLELPVEYYDPAENYNAVRGRWIGYRGVDTGYADDER